MKEKKRIEIIESAIKLFAKNGSTNTSVQVIVDNSGISKGAFYHYFTSKEELHIAIFQYYFEQMNIRAREIELANLKPREKMIEQLGVPFEQLDKEREFLMMYMREQNFPLNKDLGEFKGKIQYETITRYERNLKEIYGEKISTYIGDIILFIEGIRNSYMEAILFQHLQIDTTHIPNYTMNRIDDIVNAFEKGEEPIVKNPHMLLSSPNGSVGYNYLNKNDKVASLLADMQEQIEIINLSEEQKSGLNSVLEFLSEEIKKSNFEKYVFQGMLANLKEIEEFDIYRKKIADLLDIQLL